MAWFDRIMAAHTAVTDAVSHRARMQSERYFVWQEDGRNDLEAENVHAERAVTGYTDLFTKQEFDPWAAALEASFDARGVSWSLRDVQYEPETKFVHYTWDWEVLDGDDQI